jgi:hypothetical protein
MSDENVLTKEIAEQFLADEDQVMNLSDFTAIDDDAAETLIACEDGCLNLDGIRSLSPSTAAILGKFQDELTLDGLTDLCVDTAHGLASHGQESFANGEDYRAALRLNGLSEISSEVAVVLSTLRFRSSPAHFGWGPAAI